MLLARATPVSGLLNTIGGTIDLLFDWFGISCMTTDNFCFYLQNRLIQTGGQWYSDTSPFIIPWLSKCSFTTLVACIIKIVLLLEMPSVETS
jgi:hypothetical protein